MRFVHMGGERWKWFQFRGTDFEVDLYCATTEEHAEAVGKFRVGMPGVDMQGWLTHIATHWFRAFKGAVDGAGQPIDNTLANRVAILNAPDVYAFVYGSLNNFAAWRAEGNADSGSVS